MVDDTRILTRHGLVDVAKELTERATFIRADRPGLQRGGGMLLTVVGRCQMSNIKAMPATVSGMGYRASMSDMTRRPYRAFGMK